MYTHSHTETVTFANFSKMKQLCTKKKKIREWNEECYKSVECGYMLLANAETGNNNIVVVDLWKNWKKY